MQNVSFPQIVDQLYKVFSNEAETSQYNNTQSGAQYMGLCEALSLDEVHHGFMGDLLDAILTAA